MEWTNGEHAKVGVTDTEVVIEFVSKYAHAMYERDELVVPISSIQSLEWQRPRTLSSGELRLNTGIEPPRGFIAKHNDPYAISFDKSQIDAFERLREEIQARMNGEWPPPTEGDRSPVRTGIAAEIRELAELRDEGILTDSEFELQKAKLLNS